ncbi:MAG: 23S rRNA (guanosine(2251)-2'-O)-methyltransferase RlmB [Patescibacteria group bacterium]|nr:MAG: 23S rRNA (guanosine(2251)-2'-O)-methyltransferase RlmB [Patescibacteria group bacterium]
MKQNKIYIYGKHAVMEALVHAPGVVDKVSIAKGNEDKALQEAIRKAGIKVSSLGSAKGSWGVGDSVAHQGIIGRVSLDRLMRSYDEFINDIEITPDTSLIILGEIQDPHNVGAIIRSAAAFGVSAVLIPKHNQAPITGAVVKVSAGMAFRVPLVEIGNINNVMRDLKKRGFWVYGLEGGREESVMSESYDKPSVFILGNESKGIRDKTRDLCDTLISIPISPKCESLNVAASAAVTLFSWSLQHPEALK